MSEELQDDDSVVNAADVADYFGAQFKSQKVERLEQYQASI